MIIKLSRLICILSLFSISFSNLSNVMPKFYNKKIVSMSFRNWLSNSKDIQRIEAPVTKTKGEPVLNLVHPSRGSKITLVGVSHGSAASASLVEQTLNNIKPNAVIVELCEDRLLTISLESKIRPIYNSTLNKIYEKKLVELENKIKLSEGKSKNIVKSMASTLKFASSQGIFGGVFVILGLMISALQKFTREANSSDEFVTSMKIANQMKIPVILGDAPQNDTLKSIQKIFTFETFNPKSVYDGSVSLVEILIF